MPAGDKKTILLVEDEAILAIATARMVRDFGYEVLTASGGEKALAIALGEGGVDLVLMDIDLGGGIDGPEAATRILAARTLPIVFLTSHSEREMVERVRGITRYGYVIKNSGAFVLRSSIEMAFELFDAQEDARAKMKALAESEEKYRAAFVTSPDAVNINALDGTYVDINEGFSKLTGYTREDVIGVKSTEIRIWAIPEDRERLVAGLRATGVVENLESRFRRKDGSLTTAIMSARIIRLRGEPHILSVTRDISERKAAEEALRESEDRYRILFDMSLVAKCVADAETGVIVDCNQRMLELTGRTRAELIGQPRSILHPPESPADGGRSTFERHRDGEMDEVLEDRILTAGGEIRDVEIKASPVFFHGRPAMVGEFSDITERKRTALRLDSGAAHYEHLFRIMPAAILIVDADDRIIKCNEEFTRVFGFAPEECLGKVANELIVPARLRAEGRDLAEHVPRGERVSLESERLRKDGSSIRVAITGAPVAIDGTALAYVVYQVIGRAG